MAALKWHRNGEERRESSNGEKYGGNGKIAKIKRNRKWRNGVKISAAWLAKMAK
jgi:hypothetical protein